MSEGALRDRPANAGGDMPGTTGASSSAGARLCLCPAQLPLHARLLMVHSRALMSSLSSGPGVKVGGW